MRKFINRISGGIDWLVFAGWYNGGDLGDGILVSLLSGMVFIGSVVCLIIYGIYKLL